SRSRGKNWSHGPDGILELGITQQPNVISLPASVPTTVKSLTLMQGSYLVSVVSSPFLSYAILLRFSLRVSLLPNHGNRGRAGSRSDRTPNRGGRRRYR